MSVILVIIVGYILGSLPFSFWLGKAKGVDLRRVGSGNIGATNLARSVGTGWGIIAFALDLGKGLLAVILAGFIFTLFKDNLASSAMLKIIGGIMSIFGHNWSMWINFKGGKGVATSAGVFLGLAPIPLILALVIWLVVFVLSGYVSLASIVASISLPIWMLIGIGGRPALPIIIFSCIVTVLIIIRHSSNIVRLMQGRENKFGRKFK
jgi:glycerol-3-phosphate acyltransferase PlsY